MSPYLFNLGSSASLNPSPNKLNASIIILIATAGNINLYGYDDIPDNASDAKEPKLASGLLTPIPKKLKKASVNIAEGICKYSCN